LGVVVPSSEPENRSVVVATLVFAPIHDRQSYERDRAIYVHENLQPIVFDIERTLLGPTVPSRIIAFVSVERTDRFSVEWLGSYGLLAPSEWRSGEKFVVILATRGQYKEDCQRFTPTRDRWSLEPGLDAYKELRGYCASLGDIYPLAQSK
jgi:hypothetical protein